MLQFVEMNGKAKEKPPVLLYSGAKAILDFCLALFMLALTFPLILLAALLIKLTSRGPAFYTQIRVGKEGKPFTIYKLRTMTHNCEKESGPRWASSGDPRVTPIGRFLRRTHIDELPQLWNVLRGDMSLVGPRPERPEFVPRLEQAIPHYRERLQVRPGLTGLAQVQLPPDSDLASVRRKLSYDLYYVQRLSFWLDIRILLSTGCYILGIPFTVARILFFVPSGPGVEQPGSRGPQSSKVEPAGPRPQPPALDPCLVSTDS